MPAEDLAIRAIQPRTGTEWYDYWMSLDETQGASTERASLQVLDKETLRKKREAASGYYVDSSGPFNAPLADASKSINPDDSRIRQSVEEVANQTRMAMAIPRLEKPIGETTDLEALLQEMNKLLVSIKETEVDQQNLSPEESDVYLYHRLIDTVLRQRYSREESCVLTQERLLMHQKVKKNIYDKMCELRDKQIEADKSAQISGWVGTGLTIGIVALFVASVVVTIATGGAGSPALAASFTIAQGTLGAAQGVNTAVRGHYDNESRKNERDLYGERVRRGEYDKAIKTGVQKHRESNEWVTTHITMLRHIQKSRQAVIKNT